MKKKVAKSPLVKAADVTAKKPASKKVKAKADMPAALKDTLVSPSHEGLRGLKKEGAGKAEVLMGSIKQTVVSRLSIIRPVEAKKPSISKDFSAVTIDDTDSDAQWSKPASHRVKLAFVAMIFIGAAAAFTLGERMLSGVSESLDQVTAVFHDQTWVEGMLIQTNSPDAEPAAFAEASKAEIAAPALPVEAVPSAETQAEPVSSAPALTKEATIAAGAGTGAALSTVGLDKAKVEPKKPVKAAKSAKIAKKSGKKSAKSAQKPAH